MRSAFLRYAALLAFAATTSLAGPIISSPATAHHDDSLSPPPTPAELSLHKNSPQPVSQPPSLSTRAMTKHRVAGTNVYIMIEVGARVFTSSDITSINDMLNRAFRKVGVYASDLGWSGLIASGLFQYGGGPQIAIWNANNHQVTIRTLQLALEAVFGYMRTTFDYGVAEFDVFDGANQVGEGYVIMQVDRKRDLAAQPV